MKKIKFFFALLAVLALTVTGVSAEEETGSTAKLLEQGLEITFDSSVVWYTRDAEITEEDNMYVGASQDSFESEMEDNSEYIRAFDVNSTYRIHVCIYDVDEDDYTNQDDEPILADINDGKVNGRYSGSEFTLSDVKTTSLRYQTFGSAFYKNKDDATSGYFVTIVRHDKLYCFDLEKFSGDIGEAEKNELNDVVGTAIFKTPVAASEIDDSTSVAAKSNDVTGNSEESEGESFITPIVKGLTVILVVLIVVVGGLWVFKVFSDSRKAKRKIVYNTVRTANDLDRLNRIKNDGFVVKEDKAEKEAAEERRWLGDEETEIETAVSSDSASSSDEMDKVVATTTDEELRDVETIVKNVETVPDKAVSTDTNESTKNQEIDRSEIIKSLLEKVESRHESLNASILPGASKESDKESDKGSGIASSLIPGASKNKSSNPVSSSLIPGMSNTKKDE